jgi:dihydrofolate reductase
MRKVIVQEFTTIDGFAAGPNGEIDFITEASEEDPTTGEFVDDQLAFLETVDTILLGAETYRMFSTFWPEQTVETQGIADALNATPKVVFSRTLESAPWGKWEEARLVAGDASEEIRRLKNEPGKDMVLWGSISVAKSLITDGLVDEYRLWVCPVVLGRGMRLFEDGTEMQWMDRVETKTYGRLITVRYEPARA